MKLYLECNMGAAGDMLTAALLELLPDRDTFLTKMNSLGLPGVKVECLPAEKCGIRGSAIHVHVHGEEEQAQDVDLAREEQEGQTHFHILHLEEEHHPHHHHSSEEGHDHSHRHFGYQDVCALIEGLDLPQRVKADALAVYRLIGEAEGQVHDRPVDQVHFHEVGSLDAVADVVGCCLLFYLLAPESISASPVHVGSGFVKCAHGILPVPAPATALLLKGIPVCGGKIKGELCTPTGAALLSHFVGRFGEMEPMSLQKIGYGMGHKDFEAANCLRAFWGDSPDGQDEIVEIRCNLDDMTPEALGSLPELLMKSKALDLFFTPITMKKNRPAVMLTCLCRPQDKEACARLMLAHTSTFGVRISLCSRYILNHTFRSVQTPYGPVRIKSAAGYGVKKEKPEYEDVDEAAKKSGVPFIEVYQQAVAAMKDQQGAKQREGEARP